MACTSSQVRNEEASQSHFMSWKKQIPIYDLLFSFQDSFDKCDINSRNEQHLSIKAGGTNTVYSIDVGIFYQYLTYDIEGGGTKYTKR